MQYCLRDVVSVRVPERVRLHEHVRRAVDELEQRQLGRVRDGRRARVVVAHERCVARARRGRDDWGETTARAPLKRRRSSTAAGCRGRRAEVRGSVVEHRHCRGTSLQAKIALSDPRIVADSLQAGLDVCEPNGDRRQTAVSSPHTNVDESQANVRSRQCNDD
jgi:hypothetical protein